MDPQKLPANTEFAYAHLFTPNYKLPFGQWSAPINPTVQKNIPAILPEFQVQMEKMIQHKQRRKKRESK